MGPPEPLVIAKKIGFSAKNRLGGDGTAHRPAKAAVPVGVYWLSGGIIIKGVSVPFVIEIVLVAGAVPGIGPALGDHLNLRTSRAVEVRGLVGEIGRAHV